jgi:hypothetical protein
MSDTDTKQDTATKETADQRKEREAAEQEAKDQAERDEADIETFWSTFRGEQLVRSQHPGDSMDPFVSLAKYEELKAKKADEKDDKASLKS